MTRRGAGRGGKGAETSQQAEKRLFIIEHAVRLFAELGYSAATMDDLSARTGLNKGTLYYYFNAKSDLLYEIVAATHEAIRQCIDAASLHTDPSEAIADFVDRTIDWVGKNPEYAQVLFKEMDYFRKIFPLEEADIVRSVHRGTMKRLYTIISTGVESGHFRRCDVKVMGRAIMTMLFHSPSWRLTDMGAAAISTQLKSLVLRGLQDR